jgi:hypothetical protein
MPPSPRPAHRKIASMGVVDTFRKGRLRQALQVQRVLSLLREEPEQGMAAVVRFVQAVDDAPAVARLTELEQLRPALLAGVEPLLRGLGNLPIPFEREQLAAFRRLAVAIEALRDAFKRSHADLCEPAPDGAAAVPSPHALLALARAHDLQSRLLVAAGRLRIAMEREQWDELCRLAHPLWRTGAIEQAFAEPLPADGATERMAADTPRAAFVMPLLMRLLEPLGLSGPELDLAHVLVRAGARHAGMHIDLDGLPHVNADGPSLMLSAHHTVQIGTRDLVASIDRCVVRLAEGARAQDLGLRTPLARRALAATLARLREVWGPRYVPTPLVRPPVAQALLLVGLPRSPAAREVGLDDRARPRPPGGKDEARSVYVYGRGAPTAGGASQATSAGFLSDGFPAACGVAAAERVDRQSVAGDGAVADVPGAALLRSLGEPVVWRGQDARRAVFSRTAEGPRLRLGKLVAVLPRRPGARPAQPSPGRPGSGPTRLLVGRVVTLMQTGSADARRPFAHDVGVVFWPGSPRPARVRLDGETAYEDAWWFPGGAAGEPASLVLARDRFEQPCHVQIRGGETDCEMRIAALLERGLDHDRVSLLPVA